MNIFRLLGDLSHLAAFAFLIHRLLTRKTSIGSSTARPASAARCRLEAAPTSAARRTRAPAPAGISLKTLELYLLVFLTRYVDLFTNFVSLYNTSMKVIYIGCA